MMIGNQHRYTRRGVDDDRSGRQIIQMTRCEDSIISSYESSTASIPFSRYSPAEFWRQKGVVRTCCGADRVAKRDIVGSPAETAGSVACCESDSIVKEEQWSPGPWLCEWMFPILELCPARDPQVPVVVADQISLVIYQTAAVPGEEATRGDRVEISPRIDPIAPRCAPHWRCGMLDLAGVIDHTLGLPE
jgi:hypothetical protein